MTNLNDNSISQGIKPGNSALNSMLYIESRGCIIIADNDGCIYIYSIYLKD